MTTLFQPDLLFTEGIFRSGCGLLADDEGRIERIVTAKETVPDASVIRLKDKALLPGFANVHSHAFQRLIRGKTESRRSGGRDFWSWRGAMYHAAANLTAEQMYHVARQAFMEMALAGTIVVGEFHYVHRQPGGSAYPDPNTLAHQVIAAAQSVGIRIALLRTAYQRAGYELPPNPGQTRFLEPADEYLANTAALHDRYQSKSAWVGVAPHSIRALPITEIQPIAAWAQKHNLPIHMHVSEQKAEVAACQREYGTTPVRLLAQYRILSGRFTGVHVVHVDEEELEMFAEVGATICSCPTTERNLGDGIFPAKAAMERGIPIAFGSDSQTQIEPWEDARELEYHLRLKQQQRSILDGIRGEDLSARLFRCATVNGAASLHCNSGDLTPGKLADFFTVDLNHTSIAGSMEDDLLAAIVFGMSQGAIADVSVGGKLIVRDGRHAAQQEILDQYKEIARALWTAPQLAAK